MGKINLNNIDIDRLDNEPSEFRFNFRKDPLLEEAPAEKKPHRKFSSDKKNKPQRGGKRD